MSGDLLLVFLKSPQPGSVKTRLAGALGEAAAAELYRAMAEEEVRSTAPREDEYERLFFHAPAEAGPAMEAWFPGQSWIPQQGADLGSRMAHAFATAFDRGGRRAVLIGSDVPWLSRDTVGEALAVLADHDVVLGPADDGGYYLVGLRAPLPALFTGIAWSTGSVLAATVERAGVLGRSVRLLGSLRDVDTLDDVRAEWDRLGLLLASRPALKSRIASALAATGGEP